MTSVGDVAAETGRTTAEVLAACRTLDIVASSSASGLSADEHRRLRAHLGAADLAPVPAGSTATHPGAGPPTAPPSLEARAAELAARARRPRLSPRTLTRAGLVVFLLVAVGVAVTSLRDRADAPAARCVDLAGGAAEAVPCDQPHDAEVLAVQPMADGPFPGPAALGALAEARCRAALVERLGADLADRGLELLLLLPTEASWAAGDRSATCLVEDPDGPLVGALGTDR